MQYIYIFKSNNGNHSGWITQLFVVCAAEVTYHRAVMATVNTQPIIILY